MRTADIKRSAHMPLGLQTSVRCPEANATAPGGLGFNGEPTVIRDSQIDAVQSMLANGMAASPHPFLKLGQGCVFAVAFCLGWGQRDSCQKIARDW
jgi:hypothetical protein